jgi:hypothetical protein
MQLTCFRTWAAGLGFVLRCRAEMLVEPPVGGAPGLGTLLAKLPTQNIRAAAGERQPAIRHCGLACPDREMVSQEIHGAGLHGPH